MTVEKKLIGYAGQEKKSAWRGGPRKPRNHLQRDERFTVDTLRELILPIIKPPMKMPTDEALNKLASILERWRGDYWSDQHIDPFEHAAARAAHGLLSSLNQLRTMYHAHGSAWLTKRIKTIDLACEAVGRLFDESIAVEHGGKLTWRYLANALPADFATAMQTTNPKYKPRIGHEGPLTRFIASLAPLLTGEHPTPGAVATELKEFKSKYLNGKEFGDRIPPPPLPRWGTT